MKTYTAESLLDRKFILGEGPSYDAERGELSWVDIKAGTLYILEASGNLRQIQTGQYLGAAIPTFQGNFVALMTTGVYLMNREELLERILTPKGLLLTQRFNDAKCDRKGRLWAGTMSMFSGKPRLNRLYRFGGECIEKAMLEQLGTSNGLAWSSDNRTMYFIDTATLGVDAMDFDLESGEISNRRKIISVENGYPDGMTIDSEDMLWVAIWGGGEVRRYNPTTGECLARVEVPTPDTSSCCFGGKDLDILYITTSGEGRDGDPMAGRVYQVRCGVSGTPTDKFDEKWIKEGGFCK